MRKFATVITLSVISGLVLAPTAALSGAGHYYCTGDGIKSWSTDDSKKDAPGWTYSGDRTSYKDGGKCTKA
ncbi:MAG TPA: hypothetical protein VMJ73_01955 [Rhizomicrobium sp.]|jgi:hypothetical protein|nr:hypothetical protein [Rhizomicrobium sp.]